MDIELDDDDAHALVRHADDVLKAALRTHPWASAINVAYDEVYKQLDSICYALLAEYEAHLLDWLDCTQELGESAWGESDDAQPVASPNSHQAAGEAV